MLKEYSPRFIEEPERKPEYDDSVSLPDSVHDILRGRGIERLWKHQAQAIRAVRDGKNLVLVAPTAAGKTECYMVPVVEAALEGKTSLLIFPTKALSRDQWARIREFALLGVRAEVYDGDTPQGKRSKIRNDFPHVVITNADMLHYMLMHFRLWKGFLEKLKFIVVDEIHAYSGTVGSHVANVLWRLKRVQRLAGNAPPRFIVSSATVGNPLEFAAKVCGEDEEGFELVVGQGSPRGKVTHAIVAPAGESIVTSCLKIAKELDRHTIIFGNSHSMVERMGMVARKMNMPVEVYRSGLPPDKRRDLEVGFHSGRIKMLASTSALELGMDVGGADACILAGFPGTITRLRQRIGRVGRKGQESIAVFVARENPLDLYYAEHPEIYLYGRAESCHAKPDNPFVRKSHLLAAAKDWPIQAGEMGEEDEKLLAMLAEEEMLKEWAGMRIPTKEGTKKVQTLSLRNAGGRVRVIDAYSKKSLGERESGIAIGELFKGAIYLIGGQRFVSGGLDLEQGVAFVEPMRGEDGIYTQALRNKHAKIIETHGEMMFGDVALQRGKVHISNEVYGYVTKDSFSGATVSRAELDEPLVHEFDTYAFWADWSSWADGTPAFAEGLHALEHVTISMMPALSGADPAEIGGISYPNGTVFYYEGQAGGSGLAEVVMPRYAECVGMAFERLRKCECDVGCPKCIFSPQCGNDNHYLDKDRGKKLAEGGLVAAKAAQGGGTNQ